MVRLALALVLLLASTAAAESQRAVSADVAAEITWVAGKDRPPHGLRVTIERAGRKLVDDHVGDGPAFPQIRKAVRVRDLDGDHEPEVLVDAYSGGAHCCERTRVYSFDGSGYAFTVHQWGNQDYALRDPDRDGRPELVSADDRFAYAFSAYAFSVFPVRIYVERGGRLLERTRDYPGAVRRDLRRTHALYRGARGFKGSELAAYVADLHQLGRHADARRAVRRALRRGELRRHHRTDLGPFGRAYVRRLTAILRSGGYLR
jgi:hypothetical protein